MAFTNDKYFRNHFSIVLVQTRVRTLCVLSGLEVQGYVYSGSNFIYLINKQLAVLTLSVLQEELSCCS